jgi:hypothetical protein
LQVIRVRVASGFDAEQDAAAANACVVNFGAMFRDACADERADDARLSSSGRPSSETEFALWRERKNL